MWGLPGGGRIWIRSSFSMMIFQFLGFALFFHFSLQALQNSSFDLDDERRAPTVVSKSSSLVLYHISHTRYHTVRVQ